MSIKLNNHDNKLEQLLNCLPQTQCELCQHPGCKPYAQAILNGEDDISKCHPGGEQTLYALAKITDEDPSPWVKTVKQNYKRPSKVVIDPNLCIGCTKCIQACPVDAIIGRSKTLHAVIESECTGCDLCLPACPMDCMHSIPSQPQSTSSQTTQKNHFRSRFEAKQQRQEDSKQQKKNKHQQQKLAILEKLKALQTNTQ